MIEEDTYTVTISSTVKSSRHALTVDTIYFFFKTSTGLGDSSIQNLSTVRPSYSTWSIIIPLPRTSIFVETIFCLYLRDLYRVPKWLADLLLDLSSTSLQNLGLFCLLPVLDLLILAQNSAIRKQASKQFKAPAAVSYTHLTLPTKRIV